MNLFIIVIFSILAGLCVIFGSLYFGAKSQGFIVPQKDLPLGNILNFIEDCDIKYTDKSLEKLTALYGVPLKNARDAQMMRLTVNNEMILVTALCWLNEADALNFWKNYCRGISKNKIRQSSFRNNLWRPNFIVGRYGSNAKFDISAWYEGKWFFYVGVSTKLSNFNEIKIKTKNCLIEQIRKLEL